MTLEEALIGKEIPSEIRENLELILVPFYSFDGSQETGELVVHHDCVHDLEEIFAELLNQNFPIEKMISISVYDWDDDRSMAHNNSSAFNYRFIAGTSRLSNHASGRAIDINPRLNPYTQRDGKIVPEGAYYDPDVPGTITPPIAELFKKRGWTWGGDWINRRDWQHFEKP